MEPTATGSKARWAPQARRVWAGAEPQRAARTGAGAYRGGLPPTACYCSADDDYREHLCSARDNTVLTAMQWLRDGMRF